LNQKWNGTIILITWLFEKWNNYIALVTGLQQSFKPALSSQSCINFGGAGAGALAQSAPDPRLVLNLDKKDVLENMPCKFPTCMTRDASQIPSTTQGWRKIL
jgi:hypothetical protein